MSATCTRATVRSTLEQLLKDGSITGVDALATWEEAVKEDVDRSMANAFASWIMFHYIPRPWKKDLGMK